MDRFRKHTQASSCTQCVRFPWSRAAHSVAEPSLWRGMSSSSASYAIGDSGRRSASTTTTTTAPAARLLRRRLVWRLGGRGAHAGRHRRRDRGGGRGRGREPGEVRLEHFLRRLATCTPSDTARCRAPQTPRPAATRSRAVPARRRSDADAAPTPIVAGARTLDRHRHRGRRRVFGRAGRELHPTHRHQLARRQILAARRPPRCLPPGGYPASVRPEYLRFQAYDTLQAACSYLRNILTTSAILRGAGVGGRPPRRWRRRSRGCCATASACSARWFFPTLRGRISTGTARSGGSLPT